MMFKTPLILFLLFLIVPLGLFTFWQRQKQKTDLSFFRKHHLIQQKSPFMRYVRSLLLLLTFVFCVLALSGPLSNPHYPLQNQKAEENLIHSLMERKKHEVVFLIDTSLSMSLKDTRQGESRLTLAKEIASTIIQALKGEETSLIAFTALPTPLVPPTSDHLFARLILKDVHINEGDIGGTDYLSLFNFLMEIFKEKPIDKKASVIFLTDGGDTGLDAPQREAQLLQALHDPYLLNYQLYCVGIGSKDPIAIPNLTYQEQSVTAPLQEAILQKMAIQGRGEYIQAEARTTESIAAELLYAIQKAPVLAEQYEVIRHARGGNEELTYNYLFQIPLCAAFLALMALLALDRKKTLLLFFLCLCTQVSALQNPQAYEEAISITADPRKLSILHYNYGTYLLHEGAYDEALGQFNEALRIKNISPQLTARLQHNRAAALFSLTEKMVADKAIESNQAHALYNRCIEMLNDAQNAQCLSDRYKGKKECQNNEESLLKEIQKADKTLPPLQFNIENAPSKEYQALYKALIKTPLEEKDFQNLLSISQDPLILKAREAFKNKEEKKAKFYLRVRLYALTSLSVVEDPQPMLKMTIESLQRAIDENIELQEMQTHQKEDVALLLSAQKETLNLAQAFVKVVRTYQEKQYKQKGACLRSPWNRVLPLFFEGYRLALMAARYLEGKNPYAALLKQNDALEYWEKALSAFASHDEEENRQDSSIAELMRSIVEMQADDEKISPQEETRTKGGIDKPW